MRPDPAALLLDRLDRVVAKGADRWMACCPAHEDGSPSLSIQRTGDRVLVHCFAGCGTAEVVEAVGLSLSDLFDEPPEPYHRPALEHPPVPKKWVDDVRWIDTGRTDEQTGEKIYTKKLGQWEEPRPTRQLQPSSAVKRSELRVAIFDAQRYSLRAAIGAANVAQGVALSEEDLGVMADAARHLHQLASRFRAWEF